MLRHGVRTVVLRVVLRAMRAWYRLTDLIERRRGEKHAVTAVLNPQMDPRDNLPEAEDIVRRNEQRLLASLESAGESMFQDPRLPALGQRLQQQQQAAQNQRAAAQRAGNPGNTVVRPARPGLTEAFVIREGIRPAGHERISMAGGPASPFALTEQQRQNGSGQSVPGLIKVLSGLGTAHYVAKPPHLKEAAEDKLQRVHEMLLHSMQNNVVGSGNRDLIARRRMQKAFFELVLRQRPSDPFFGGNPEAAATMAAIARLMPTVEGARHPAGAITNLVAWELADFPDATWRDVVSDTNMMAPPNAVRGSGFLTDPARIRTEMTNARTGDLTVAGRQTEVAVAQMRANASRLLVRAFAVVMTGNLYLNEEQLINDFPGWAKRNAGRLLAPGGYLLPPR
jgi:hypothetical protein